MKTTLPRDGLVALHLYFPHDAGEEVVPVTSRGARSLVALLRDATESDVVLDVKTPAITITWTADQARSAALEIEEALAQGDARRRAGGGPIGTISKYIRDASHEIVEVQTLQRY